MAGARLDIGAVHPVGREQQFGHARRRRRAEHLQLAEFARTLVPAVHHEPRIVHAVVVMQVGEEAMGDIDRPPAGLQQPVVGAGPMVEDDRVAAGLDQVARAHALQRGRGRAGAEQGEAHVSPPAGSRRRQAGVRILGRRVREGRFATASCQRVEGRRRFASGPARRQDSRCARFVAEPGAIRARIALAPVSEEMSLRPTASRRMSRSLLFHEIRPLSAARTRRLGLHLVNRGRAAYDDAAPPVRLPRDGRSPVECQF